MPALDRFHNAVYNALVADGWTITNNPLTLRTPRTSLYIDLGAEKLIAAEKDARRIAVEVKTFVGNSMIAELQQVVGQYGMYEDILGELDPDRVLYLAIPDRVLAMLEADYIGQTMLRKRIHRVIAFSVEAEVIVEWKP